MDKPRYIRALFKVVLSPYIDKAKKIVKNRPTNHIIYYLIQHKMFFFFFDPLPKKNCPFLSVLVSVLLSPSVKRFSVSRIRDFF